MPIAHRCSAGACTAGSTLGSSHDITQPDLSLLPLNIPLFPSNQYRILSLINPLLSNDNLNGL